MVSAAGAFRVRFTFRTPNGDYQVSYSSCTRSLFLAFLGIAFVFVRSLMHSPVVLCI